MIYVATKDLKINTSDWLHRCLVAIKHIDPSNILGKSQPEGTCNTNANLCLPLLPL